MGEFEFFVNNDLSEFVGKWVAILDNKVVVASESFREVAEAVDRKFKGRKPLIARIPENKALIL